MIKICFKILTAVFVVKLLVYNNICMYIFYFLFVWLITLSVFVKLELSVWCFVELHIVTVCDT